MHFRNRQRRKLPPPGHRAPRAAIAAWYLRAVFTLLDILVFAMAYFQYGCIAAVNIAAGAAHFILFHVFAPFAWYVSWRRRSA